MLLGRKAIGTVAYMGGLPAVLEEFTWCWGQLIQYNAEVLGDDKHYVNYERTRYSDHAPARNNLAATFLGDWLIQLDTDHQFEPDIVARLLRHADEIGADVMSGFYQMKSSPHGPVLYQDAGTPEKPFIQPIAEWPPELRVMEIGSAGGGCLFVRRTVFDRIARAGEGPFDRTHPYSEDHSFFIRCRKLGIKAYAALKIRADHLRVKAVTPDDFDPSGLMIAGAMRQGFE